MMNKLLTHAVKLDSHILACVKCVIILTELKELLRV